MATINLAEISSHQGNYNTTGELNKKQRGRKPLLNQSADPIDGRWAILVAIAAFIAQAILGFITYSLPILSVEWEKRIGATPSQASWSITLVNAIRFCTAPVVGSFINRFGCRPVVFAGGILAMLSSLLLSLAKELWQINICCAGIGAATGLANQGTIIIVSMYFDRWLGRANGFAQGGIGVGLLVGSPLMALLIEAFTWRGAVLILAGTSANICVASGVYRPLSWWTNEKTLPKKDRAGVEPQMKREDETDLMTKRSMVIKESRIDDSRIGCENPTFVEKPAKQQVTDGHIQKQKRHHCHEGNVPSTLVSTSATVGKDGTDSSKEDQTDVSETDSTKHSSEANGNMHIKHQARLHVFFKYLLNLFGFSLLWTNTNIPLLCLVSLFRGFGYFPSYIYLSSYIVASGVSTLKASFIFTIIGICSLVGRFTHGFLIDFDFISSPKLFGLSTMVAGGSVYIIVLFGSYTSFAVFAVIFGLSSGAMVALVPVVTKRYTAPSELVNAFALQMFFVGVSQLLGTYFLGLIYDETNKYVPCFCFTGALLFTSGVIVLLLGLMNRRFHPPHHRLVCC